MNLEEAQEWEQQEQGPIQKVEELVELLQEVVEEPEGLLVPEEEWHLLQPPESA